MSHTIDDLSGVETQGAAPEMHKGPAPLTLIVLCIGLAITGVLSWVTYSSNVQNEGRLLRLQAHQAATSLSGALPTIQTPLASAVEIAGATGGDPAKFDAFMKSFVGPLRPFVSASLWRESGSSVVNVATVGSPADHTQRRNQVQSFFDQRIPSGVLAVFGMLDDGQRIGFGYGSLDIPGRYIAYAQAPLPAGHRAVVAKNSPYSDLNFDVYLGRSVRAANLIETTGSESSMTSPRTVISVPFGNTFLTIVATPDGQLGGALLQRLPWIVATGGVVLSAAAALVTEILVRRRRNAERLAEENRRLFSQQLTIAETLQHALLPAQFPDLGDITGLQFEVATKYLAGVQPLEIGGDWYDVVTQAPDRLTFVVGDVSGRGLEAATVMASLRFAIRGFASEGHTPDIILSKLGALLDVQRDGHFATVLCGQIDSRDRQLTLASAGHPAPLLITGDDQRFLETSLGPPVGVVPGQSYGATIMSMPNHGTLLAFTDGLVERRGENLALGLERARLAVAGPEGPLDDLLADVAGRLGAADADDDTAMLGLRWSMRELAWRN